MHNLNLLCLTLLCLTESFALKVEEVLFPIRNISHSVTNFINDYPNERPKFDIERVHHWDVEMEKEQNRRLLARRAKIRPNYSTPWDPEKNYHERPLQSESIDAILSDISPYEVEEHSVKTDDGYTLMLHRLIREDQPSDWTGDRIVYIQHGLLLSSDAYVLRKPKQNLGNFLVFTLLENNYDVWLGNARGNAYSRSHSSLTTNDSAFWDFSFHEVGEHDLRYSIDYVLNKTKSSHLNFIGFSIGATESYVLLSRYPEYNEKIRLLISISPLIFWERSDNQTSQIDEIIEKIEKLRDNSDEGDNVGTHTGELYPLSSYLEFYNYYHGFCKDTLSTFFGDLNTKIETPTCSLLSRHMPAGTSAKNLIHLLQIMKSGRFQEYDDGWYCEEYDLSKITAAHAIFVGPNETFLYKKDINELQNRFPNSVIYKLKNADGEYMNDLDFPFFDAAKSLAAAIRNLLALY